MILRIVYPTILKRPRASIGNVCVTLLPRRTVQGRRQAFRRCTRLSTTTTTAAAAAAGHTTPLASSGPISKAYESHVSTGNIQYDVEQVSVAAQLDRLYTSVVASRQQQRSSSSLLTLQGITDVKPRHALKRVSHAWRQWIFSMQQPTPPRGLYIYGSVGVGKSFLMDLFYHTIVASNNAEKPSSSSSSHRRAHFHEFMLDVHQRIHDAKQITPRGDVLPTVALDLARQGHLLCFDEFQVTDIADAMILQRLFGMLWRAGVVVVATSNRAPSHLYEGGINRSRFVPFIDLLQTRMDVVHMTGQQDYRRLQTNDEPLTHENDGIKAKETVLHPPYFFWPAEAPATRQALQGMFDTFADENQHATAHGKESVPVPMGRSITVSRVAGPLAWLNFDELCAQPLGAADYLALCRRFRIVIVDYVPQLDANTFNEARRFVTFIDAVYETKTRLVLSTAVPIHRLFLQFDAQVETNDGDEEIAVQGSGIHNNNSSSSSESVVTDKGGASSSHATTMIQQEDGTQVEWSATGRIGVSLAQLSAVRDVAFSFARAESRLAEMSRPSWGRE